MVTGGRPEVVRWRARSRSGARREVRWMPRSSGYRSSARREVRRMPGRQEILVVAYQLVCAAIKIATTPSLDRERGEERLDCVVAQSRVR